MIDVSSLYQDICQALGNGHSNDRLQAQFPRAFNRALNDLSVSVDHPQWPAITGTDSTIDFPDQYEYVLFAGVQYYLIRMGHAPADPKLATIVYQDSAKQWADGKADYKQNEDNILMADPENDIIGLGSVE